MKIIVITSPDEIKCEAQKIEKLLCHCADCVHIRKPDWSLRQVKTLVEEIPVELRSRLRLHGHFELLNEFNLAGAHINSRCTTAPTTALSVSKSCHSLEELADTAHYKYVTLSPIFDSISKTGYNSKFDLKALKEFNMPDNVVALGGVTPEKLPILNSVGFMGAALLGYIWNAVDNSDFEYRINQINKYN